MYLIKVNLFVNRVCVRDCRGNPFLAFQPKKIETESLTLGERPKVLEHSYSGKGNFGQVLEKFYFGYEPNSVAEADFAQIGMELKSSPLKQLKNDEFRSKERLALNNN